MILIANNAKEVIVAVENDHHRWQHEKQREGL